MLLISIKHGFVFLADLQRHLTLTEETSKVRIVIFQPDTCTVFDVLIVVVRITGAAGAKERHIPTRNSRKQIADFQTACTPVNTKTNKISGSLRQGGKLINTTQILCHARESCKDRSGELLCVSCFTLIQNHIIQHDHGLLSQLFLIKCALHLGQRISIFPFPRGIRIF